MARLLPGVASEQLIMKTINWTKVAALTKGILDLRFAICD